MEDPQFTYHGLDQATQVPHEAWKELFRMCLEWAEIARQRKAARVIAQKSTDLSGADDTVGDDATLCASDLKCAR